MRAAKPALFGGASIVKLKTSWERSLQEATVSSILLRIERCTGLQAGALVHSTKCYTHSVLTSLWSYLKRNVQAISNPRSTSPSHNEAGWRGLLQGQPHWLHGSSYGIWRIHYRLQKSQALQLSGSDQLSGMLGVLLGGTSQLPLTLKAILSLACFPYISFLRLTD